VAIFFGAILCGFVERKAEPEPKSLLTKNLQSAYDGSKDGDEEEAEGEEDIEDDSYPALSEKASVRSRRTFIPLA
jgi:hypothetical protein